MALLRTLPAIVIELLLQTTPSGAQQHYAEEIKKATGRAAQLTRQLLAFSRKQVLYPTVLDLNAIVHDVGKILQRLIGEDVQVVTALETRLVDRVVSAQACLRQLPL